ncbi:hypothetical protein D9M73_75460 [compost metagenome]|nr:MAG TPA: hypothetical protein [Caudoviricetes sp.]
MAAPIHNFTGDYELNQGSAISVPFLYTDPAGAIVDLTGYTARMQVRAGIGSAVVLLELTTENGGLVIDGAAGKLTMVITEALAEGFTWRRGVYDIELVPASGEGFRFVQGEIEISPEVTRAS